jgi:antitoxin (DNA-binding transcriptional repressor) of toxin-antitoxin stability system
MPTETASVAQLKAGLSSYLAKARNGITIEVTSHRKVIAQVTGAANERMAGLPATLAPLVLAGRLTPGNGTALLNGLPPPVRLAAGSPDVSEMVLQDRGAR